MSKKEDRLELDAVLSRSNIGEIDKLTSIYMKSVLAQMLSVGNDEWHVRVHALPRWESGYAYEMNIRPNVPKTQSRMHVALNDSYMLYVSVDWTYLESSGKLCSDKMISHRMNLLPMAAIASVLLECKDNKLPTESEAD